jgi:prepilin-type N-terminal cleavage/methylation domain-containing protein
VTGRLEDEGGYSLIELLVVVTILTVVLGGIVTLFVQGLNAESDQNRRFQAQQDTRLALDKMRREIHAACTISAPATYNTPVSSVTLYMGADGCLSGANTVTWCTTGSAGRYGLYKVGGTSCTNPVNKIADYLTSGTIFTYLPPGSHLVSSSSLGMGTSSSYIVTQDSSGSLPRLHVDLTSQLRSGLHDSYRLADDIAFRNGPRACASGVASC